METQQKLVSMLWNKFGIEADIKENYRKDTGKTYKYLSLRKAAYLKLIDIVAPYLHPVMHYKVKELSESRVGTYQWQNGYKNYGGIVVSKLVPKAEQQIVYDVKVKDNHNFIVASTSRARNSKAGGPILHNCQNLTPHEVKTIVTRAGKNTKLVFTGDIGQIDNPYLDASSNGLTYLVEKMKSQKISGHVTLTKGERSELAEIASNIL